MSENWIKSDLKRALQEIGRLEYERVSAMQDDRDARQVELIIRMKPLMRFLIAMKAETGEVDGLDFNIDLGYCAHITTTTRGSDGEIKRTYMISFKADYLNSSIDYSKYTICAMTGNNGSDGYELCELESIDEVVAWVTEIVGKHIGALRADLEHKQKRALLFTRELFALQIM